MEAVVAIVAVAVPLLFAMIHLPLAFDGASTAGDVALGVAVLVGTGVGLRLLIARLDAWSGRSLLTIGLLHASFNSSVSMAIVAGGLTSIGVLLFIGATGKSAQIPLLTWLRDAMAGARIFPSNFTEPRACGISPAITRASVLFPQPDSPMTPKVEPRWMQKPTSSSTGMRGRPSGSTPP